MTRCKLFMLLEFVERWLRDEESSLEHVAAHRMLCFSPTMSRMQHNRPSPPAALNDFLAFNEDDTASVREEGPESFPTIMSIPMKFNRATPSSAAIYRHFTLGSLAFDQRSWTKKAARNAHEGFPNCFFCQSKIQRFFFGGGRIFLNPMLRPIYL